MKTKRILSTALAILLIMSTFSFAGISATASSNVLYVNTESGSDTNDGLNPDTALSSINAAIGKLSAVDGITEGTIKFTGTFDPAAAFTFATHDFDLVIEGVGTAKYANSKGDTNFGGDITFKNMTIDIGGGKAFISKDNKITFDNVKYTNFFDLGPLGGTSVNKAHLVIDGGSSVASVYFGGGYPSSKNNGVSGNVYIEILDGSISNLYMGPDYYSTSGVSGSTVGGDFRLTMGENASIANIADGKSGGGITTIKGYLHTIAPAGKQLPVFPSKHFENYGKTYAVSVLDGTNGTVKHAEKTGHFVFEPNDGYVAEIIFPDGTVVYTAGAEIEVPLGTTMVSFTNAYSLPAQKDFNIEIVKPDPIGDIWNDVVITDDNYDVTVEAKDPDDAHVAFSTEYTYDILVTPKAGQKIPYGATFTINGSSEYKIKNLEATSDKVSFSYKLPETDRDPDDNKAMISYFGGIGSLGDAPKKEFVAKGSQITVSTENYFAMGGYMFAGYTVASNVIFDSYEELAASGITVYNGGDTVTVDEDIRFTAIWVKLSAYEVSFESADGTEGYAPETLSAYANTYVEVPLNTFARLGERFTHWTDLVSGKNYNPGDLLLVTDNIVLTAQWTVDAETGEFIYVSASNGSSANDGLTVDTAVDTLSAAYSLAKAYAEEGKNATIVVMGSVTMRGILPTHSNKVTITGYNASSKINVSGPVKFGGDTEIRDIALNVTKTGSYIATNGNKVVLGPNLPNNSNYALDIVDGAVGASASMIDTTIRSGVAIGKYSVGGAEIPADVVDGIGPVHISINGATIETLDFSARGTGKAKLAATSVVEISDATIGEITSTNGYAQSDFVTLMVVFNNGSAPTQYDAELAAKLSEGPQFVYFVDSGVGGTVVPSGDEMLIARGTVTATPDNIAYAVRKEVAGEYKLVSSGTMTLTNGEITKIRYGTPYTANDKFVINVNDGNAPIGGASIITVSPTLEPNSTVAKAEIESWTPAINEATEKFEYETLYTVNVRIIPEDGYFFDGNILDDVSFIINGEMVQKFIQSDGSVIATYTFAQATNEAQEVIVNFSKGGDDVVGDLTVTTAKWEHLSTQDLPTSIGLSKLGYIFGGWRCDADGKLYTTKYTVDSSAEVINFTAEWIQRGSWDLPEVILLYDLTALGRDTGRNPKFAADDKPIYVEKAFASLEHNINGTKNTKTVAEFEHEKNVTIITSDGGANPIMINNWSLNKENAKISEYTQITVVYYYATKNANAAGEYASCRAVNVALPDGTTKSIGKTINSAQPIVANKWAYATFDFSSAFAESGVDGESLLRQIHLSPIGGKKCSELSGDTLYLKALILSKGAPVED